MGPERYLEDSEFVLLKGEFCMPREGGQSGVLRKLSEPVILRKEGRGTFHAGERYPQLSSCLTEAE